MARAPSDIDPKRLDAVPKRNRRKHRDKPDPHPGQQAQKAKALARALKRPIPPGVTFEHDGEGYTLESPHNDRDLFDLAIADAFGTRHVPSMRVFMAQLRDLCGTAYDHANEAWKPDETEMSAALAMVSSMRPEDEAQAALAAQMVATHWMAMRLAKQALNSGGMVMEQDAALSAKLSRTYVQLMQGMRDAQGKKRSTVRQSIKVSRETHHHQHIHVHRGDGENETQAHERTAHVVDQRAALPSQGEADGKVVPLPSRPK